MKKRYTILVVVILFLIILTTIGYFLFSKKLKEFLNSENSIAEVANTYISYKKGEEDGFSFAVLSDSESGEGTTSQIYKNIISSINESEAKFLIHIGDFTGRGLDLEYQEFTEFMHNNSKIPYYVAPGNHDILQDKETKTNFKKYFENLYYSFDYSNAHFIILDNSNNKYGFDTDQITWLENDLKENQEKQIFVFMHRPIDIPYANKIDVSDGATKAAKESYTNFRELLKKYKVTEIFAGHIHIYISYRLENVPVIITGGAGSEPNLPFWENVGSFNHYIMAKVRSDSYTTKIVEIE
jgi:3',5'-cyclic AMP phosphodiesterase CpdA